MEKFENIAVAEQNKNLAELYTIGKTYEFYIESEEKTPHGKGLFILQNKEFGTQHHFCFNGEHSASPGETIRLTVSGFTPNGYLTLTDPNVSISEYELKNLCKIDDMTYERENQHLELKSSFAYTSNSTVDIDNQLGWEIMQQVAAMLNSTGGEVRVGYRRDGKVCGINKDLPFINSSKTDSNKYQPALDGIELKFRNTIIAQLGRYANNLISIEFFKTAGNLLVIHLGIKPASIPIYWAQRHLYVRAGNTCVHMLGNDITSYICERCGIAKPDFPEEKISEQTVISRSGNIAGKAKADEVSRYITLYKNGEISTQDYAIAESSVLYDIPFSARQMMDPDTRLVLAYENGHCAFFHPYDIVTQKLHSAGERYMNGWNLKSKIIDVMICNVNDYIAINSERLLDNNKMLKAVSVKKYRTYGGNSLQSQGFKIIDKQIAKASAYTVVPGSEFEKIKPVYMMSGYTAGHSVNKPSCAEAVEFVGELQKNIAA